ncbi:MULTISPECIES: hypothetical protein [Gracilibacillus]|uniref:hypothetical protein n=1 Tax=Gracilibacillus TaxID=74385 RepID=UPI0008270912|nr:MULTISPECIES: hypothetical protein [Gracilibacillus]
MLTEWWKELERVSDYLLVTKQAEMFSVIYITIGLTILYFTLRPLISLLVLIEWKAFMTYSFVIMIMLVITAMIQTEIEGKYLIVSCLIFTSIVCFHRLFRRSYS